MSTMSTMRGEELDERQEVVEPSCGFDADDVDQGEQTDERRPDAGLPGGVEGDEGGEVENERDGEDLEGHEFGYPETPSGQEAVEVVERLRDECEGAADARDVIAAIGEDQGDYPGEDPGDYPDDDCERPDQTRRKCRGDVDVGAHDRPGDQAGQVELGESSLQLHSRCRWK